ncbi:DUF4062 domain-containing protein [Spirosoma sp. HMF4905]|uniref:DUF4062 domain-containing protein n=1 Tax=Spirosoma arboris TaxID=2682092 RepID=A0A7K1SM54_9BACT|nr:DUF4062 domain-containing protein [Spirosoma arboris]MVM34881.1 DUF4062 domain-containing protein [Spirosoma arboris]
MASKKKLQVFISSTFTDLQEERQAAVSAILTAGHIPAGMELFTAGDESQMQVIKRWIDESDVYLLILGSRYGSVEPISGKSYTQLEYEYAIEIGKPFFAVAIKESAEEKRIKRGKAFIELENPYLLKEFRKLVTSKMVRFWEDYRDIKISVLETISEFSRREDLVGWIPGNESTNSIILAEEIVRLTKENTDLKKKINEIPSYKKKAFDLTFEESYDLFSSFKVHNIAENDDFENLLISIAQAFGDSKYSLLHYIWFLKESNPNADIELPNNDYVRKIIIQPLKMMSYIDVFTSSENQPKIKFYFLSPFNSFLLKLRLYRNVNLAEELVRLYNNI